MDPAELDAAAEAVDPNAVGETDDYSDFAITPVGKYVSAAREIGKITNKPDGNTTIELRFTGGITSTNNGARTYESGRFPLRNWLSSKLFSRQDRPGKTSSLAQYLRAVGVDTAGRPVKEMVGLVRETLQTPVGVRMGREDKGVKQGDGSYTNLNLRTRDFENGVDAEGQKTYAASLIRDGVTILAKAKIEGFFEIK